MPRGRVKLIDHEKLFMAKASRVVESGVRLGDLAREALTAKFGGAAEVILGGMNEETLADPTLFVLKMTKTFGRGAAGFFDPISRYIDAGVYGTGGSSPVLDLLGQIGPPNVNANHGQTPLHDFRVKDEGGNYADNSV